MTRSKRSIFAPHLFINWCMRTPIPSSQFHCLSIGSFLFHWMITFHYRNYHFIFKCRFHDCIYFMNSIHFVLNCVFVFHCVFSVHQCVDFLLRCTIFNVFITRDIKGTPYCTWTVTGVYVRVSVWLLCVTIFNVRF